MSEAEKLSCSECGSGHATGDRTFCGTCYDSNWDSGVDYGFENHECEYGEPECPQCYGTEIYCVDHAVTEWGLKRPDCKECGVEDDDNVVLCSDCLRNTSEPEDVVQALAAEGYEVNWDE